MFVRLVPLYASLLDELTSQRCVYAYLPLNYEGA